MAEGVLFNVAEGIIETLGSLVVKETKLLWGVEDELNKLKETVATIKSVLLHADEQQDNNPAVRVWLGKLNDVMYDANDLLDAISTEAQRREIMTKDKKSKKVHIFFSKSNQLAYRFKLGHEIKAIRERLDTIAADIKNFQFVERLIETPVGVVGRDSSYSFVCEEQVIGRENDKEAIIESLLNTNVEGNVSILPIVGMGGLGKTALAQLIFNDVKIQEHFELKTWVYISDQFDMKIIVEKILESVTRRRPKSVQMDQLIIRLHNKIVGKKYFLVLDDMWNEDPIKWSKLKNLLMVGAVGSRILITTRSEKVARITSTIKPYILEGLGEKQSWDLFKKMAFKNGQELENSIMVEIGREVLRKCVGVPLAIGTVGSMLFLKDSVIEWKAFREHELSKISESNETGILSTLKLSYDKLPPHLKHCFVYCSLFPKDYVFDKSTMINLWIAQGFVESQENRCLKDIGHEYFMELVSRLFFKDVIVRESNNETIFKVHDLMHDLAISEAGSLIITSFGNKKGDFTQKSRHISVCGDRNFSSLYKEIHIRTFICFSGDMDFEKIISSFKLLRVLVLRNNNVKRVPRCINDLIHLRYLDLSHNKNIKSLPNSITKLVNLHTLILSGCWLEELPKDIKKLVNLRHLDNHGCKLLYMPRGLSELTNLQTLALFSVNSRSSIKDSAGFDELCKLNNLRGMLKVYDWIEGINCVASESKVVDSNVKSIFNNLSLRRIDVDFFGNAYPTPNERCQGSGFLNHLSSLTRLVKLDVSYIERCKYLPPLCQLPFLEELELDHLYDLEYILGCGDKNEFSSSSVPITCFPSLNCLFISGCPELKGWLWGSSFAEVDNDYENSMTRHRSLPMFSCLSQLSISSCPKLTLMPIFLHVEDQLVIDGASWKPVRQTLAASSFTPLSKLKHLKLKSVLDLETLSMEELENLTSLESLEIRDSKKLKCFCQGLQHLTTLRHLSLDQCPELELSNNEDEAQWKGLKSLLSLSLKELPKLRSLPSGLQHITTLQKFCIENCESLIAIPEWIYNYKSLELLEINGCSSLTSLPKGLYRLASLKSLSLYYCLKLELVNNEDGVQWQGLKSLNSLEFYGLPLLVSLPLRLQYITTLQTLVFFKCENLTTIPEWIYNNKSLKDLQIIKCTSLISLPKGVDRLAFLEKLSLCDCPELELTNNEDGMKWQGLKSLLSLRFEGLPKLMFLPLGFQYVTTLQTLDFRKCENLTAIPEWICNYKSLKMLVIFECSSLTSLPEGMRSLMSLRSLTIWNCPVLFQRCKKETGEDWRKIAHIPSLDIYEF